MQRIGDPTGQDAVIACMAHGQGGAEITEGYAPTLNCNHEQPIVLPINTMVVQGRPSDDLMPRDSEEHTPPLRAGESGTNQVPTIAYRTNAAGQVNEHDGIAATLNTQTDPTAQFLQQNMMVRRLLPIECERLQGFPDNYTNIPGASDSARYKALGNSMAVNVMQLIGERIQMVDDIK